MNDKSDYSLDVLSKYSPLLMDLQTRFLQIKALAEVSSSDKNKNIEMLASHGLATIDHSLFAIDSHQLNLPLTTVSSAAVAIEVMRELDALAKEYNVSIDLDIARSLGPVFSNKQALKGSLYGMISSLIIARPADSSKNIRIVVVAKSDRQKQKLGIYSKDIPINSLVIKQLNNLSPTARSLAPAGMHHSGVGLHAAEHLTDLIGSPLKSFKYKGMKGVGFSLPLSNQLSFV